jgi:hypothetical protein
MLETTLQQAAGLFSCHAAQGGDRLLISENWL